MTKQILKKAMELNQEITAAENRAQEIREAIINCEEKRYTGKFYIEIRTKERQNIGRIEIPAIHAKASLELILKEVIEHQKRLENAFQELN